MNDDLRQYLNTLLIEMKGMNARLDVLIRKDDELIKINKEVNEKLTSDIKDKQSESEKQVIRDSKGRILGLTAEDFYNMRRQGYSLSKISRITGWSVSHFKPLIYDVERQRGEK